MTNRKGVLFQAIFLIGCGCLASAIAASGANRGLLLNTQFQNDPLKAGWTQAPMGSPTFEGRWAPGAAGERSHLLVEKGAWESPPVPVQPFRYYHIHFQSRAPQKAYVAALFLDEQGHELQSDVYDSLFPGSDWHEQDLCFRAYPLAKEVKLRFQAISAPVEVSQVRLEETDSARVARWADEVAAKDPPLHYPPPAARGVLLPRTMAALRHGGKLRVVVLGDSIANDTGNSLFETLLHRRHPRTRFEVVNSTRGGTGCTWYQQENRVETYVLQFQPDLLIIAGISHNYDTEAIRSVIRQVRAHSGTEILVLRDAITPEHLMEEGYLKTSGLPGAQAQENIRTFPGRLARMAEEEKVELMDLRSPWNSYIAASSQPQEWFMRDEIHASSRGKQVIGHTLAAYLEPPWNL